jgi:hypothetical protein
MASADEMGMVVRFISKEISGAPESLIYLQDLSTDQLNKRINMIMYEIDQSTGNRCSAPPSGCGWEYL